MADERRNNRRLKWLSQTLDNKTFDIEADHAAMRQGNICLEAWGFRARFNFGHGRVTTFDLNGDPNPLEDNANAGRGANANINRPPINANIGHAANVNVKIEPNNDELGPVKVEAPEQYEAPYYGPGDSSDSSSEESIAEEPVEQWLHAPLINKEYMASIRAKKGNVASGSKNSKNSKNIKVEFEEVNFGSKIIGLINDLQQKDKKKKKEKNRESYEVLDLKKPTKGNKRKRDRDEDDDDMTGLGFGGPKRARSMREVY